MLSVNFFHPFCVRATGLIYKIVFYTHPVNRLATVGVHSSRKQTGHCQCHGCAHCSTMHLLVALLLKLEAVVQGLLAYIKASVDGPDESLCCWARFLCYKTFSKVVILSTSGILTNRLVICLKVHRVTNSPRMKLLLLQRDIYIWKGFCFMHVLLYQKVFNIFIPPPPPPAFLFLLGGWVCAASSKAYFVIVWLSEQSVSKKDEKSVKKETYQSWAPP